MILWVEIVKKRKIKSFPDKIQVSVDVDSLSRPDYIHTHTWKEGEILKMIAVHPASKSEFIMNGGSSDSDSLQNYGKWLFETLKHAKGLIKWLQPSDCSPGLYDPYKKMWVDPTKRAVSRIKDRKEVYIKQCEECGGFFYSERSDATTHPANEKPCRMRKSRAKVI